MSDQRTQPTLTLAKRLQRVAKWLDTLTVDTDDTVRPKLAARANTCWQAAARLVGYMETFDRDDTMVTIGDLKTWLAHYPDATIGDTIAAYLDQCIAKDKSAGGDTGEPR